MCDILMYFSLLSRCYCNIFGLVIMMSPSCQIKRRGSFLLSLMFISFNILFLVFIESYILIESYVQ